MKIVTFKVDDDLLTMLDSYAINHGETRSETIRKAIRKMVEEDIKTESTPKAKVEKGGRL